MQNIKSNKYLVLFSIFLTICIVGIVILAIGLFASANTDSLWAWVLLACAGLMLILCMLAYAAGFESGELQGWNDSYQVNGKTDRISWVFKSN